MSVLLYLLGPCGKSLPLGPCGKSLPLGPWCRAARKSPFEPQREESFRAAKRRNETEIIFFVNL